MQISKQNIFRILIPLMVVLYFGFLYLSSLTFPGYTIWKYYISNMGHPERNPDGWIIWSIGHLINGICIIILGFYLYSKANEIRLFFDGKFKTSKYGSIFACISGLGFILMCLIPQYQGLDGYHAMNALLLIGGLYLSFIFWNLTIWQLKKIKKMFKIFFTMFSVFAPSGFILSSLISFVLYGSLGACSDGSCFWLLTMQFWEWMILIGGEFALFTLLAIIPENIDKSFRIEN